MNQANHIKPKITYEECDRLVKAYRDGTGEHADIASAQLLDAFEGYIMKFYNVIRRGKAAIHDRDIREFIKLYMKNEYTRKHIHQYKRMPVVYQEIYNVVDSVRSLCSPYADDELMNEIIVAFLTMAKRYVSHDDKPRFHTYILNAFHYQLRRQLQVLVSDPIIFKMSKNMSYYDDRYEGEGSMDVDMWDVDNFADQSNAFTIDKSFDSFNENWILGFTTGPDYRHLTVMERKILKMYYLDKMGDQAIADHLGTCRATINRRRNKAKETLRDELIRTKRIRCEE